MNVASHNAFAAGQQAFKDGHVRIVPLEILRPNGNDSTPQSIEASTHWYRGWDQENLAAPVPEIESDNVETIGELVARLEAIMRETGRSDLPVNISVLQETHNNPFGTFYEDRKVAKHIEVVTDEAGQFVELYV
jgi:hypothetical protein